MNQNPSDATIHFDAFDGLLEEAGQRMVQTPGVLESIEEVREQLAYDVGANFQFAEMSQEACKDHLLSAVALMGPPLKSNVGKLIEASNPLTNSHNQISAPALGLIQKMNEQTESVVARYFNPPFATGSAEIVARTVSNMFNHDTAAGTAGLTAQAMVGASRLYTTGFDDLAAHFTASPALQSKVEKLLQSDMEPAIDATKLGVAGLNIASLIEPQISAKDILGRTNMHLWSESLQQATEYMNVSLWNEEEILTRLKGVKSSLSAVGLDLDLTNPDSDIDTLVEENFDVVEKFAERLEADEDLRHRAAEIFVGPAFKQLTTKEKLVIFVSTVTYFYDSADKLSQLENPAWSLLGILLISLTYYFSMHVMDKTLEKRRDEKVQEILRLGLPQ